MTVSVRDYRARYVDALRKGTVFSIRRTGGDEVRVVAPPVRLKNLVGERSYVHLHVERVDTKERGTMTFSPTNVVYTHPYT